MADTDTVTMGHLLYWCREKHYRSMQNAAQDGLRKYGNDATLKFFYAYGLILEGDRVQEGMRELEALRDKRDINLCSTLALMFAHKQATSVDKEAVIELEGKFKAERKQAGEKALYFAGLFLFLSEKYEKAREYIDRVLKMNNASKEGHTIKGWNDLMTNTEVPNKKALKYFDEALGAGGQKDIDALFGKAKYLEYCHNYSMALDAINQVVVAYPSFVPALIEKMKLQLALQDWEQVNDVANRALLMDGDCLQAHRFTILQMLCREGNYQDSGRNTLVLQQCYYMEERAVSLDNTNADFVTELGFEQIGRAHV